MVPIAAYIMMRSWVALQDESIAGAFEMVVYGLTGKSCAAVAFLMRGKVRTVKA